MMSYGLPVKVENQPLSMELDTGSAVSILPYDMFLGRFFRDKKLKKTTIVPKTYTGELIVPVGCLTVQVQYLDQSCLLPLHVVQIKGPVLMVEIGFTSFASTGKPLSC